MRYWLLVAILVLGCIAAAPTDSTVRLVVSTDLGETVLINTQVTGSDNTISLLGMVSDVETTYGGKFVDSINGIRTRPDHAWFYYVNGELAGIGAAAYVPENGDTIQWDYHGYRGNPFEPAYLEPPSLE